MVQLVKKWVKQSAELSSISKPTKGPISDAQPQKKSTYKNTLVDDILLNDTQKRF